MDIIIQWIFIHLEVSRFSWLMASRLFIIINRYTFIKTILMSLLNWCKGLFRQICIQDWKVSLKLKKWNGLKTFNGKRLFKRNIKCLLDLIYQKIILVRNSKLKWLILIFSIKVISINCLNFLHIFRLKKVRLLNSTSKDKNCPINLVNFLIKRKKYL